MSESGTFAGLVAAPVWALVWCLTFGRMGKPLWRTTERERALARFRRGYNLSCPPGELVVPPPWGGGYQPTHGGDSSNPPQGGSGVPR